MLVFKPPSVGTGLPPHVDSTLGKIMLSNRVHPPFLCVLAAAALLWASFVALSPDGVFWTTDGGNKFIQMENFELHGGLSIAYPASTIDPELRFFPFSGHHFLKANGRALSFYPPYFPLISLPFHKIFGFYGIHIVPAVAAILCLAASWGIAGALGLKGWRRTASVAILAFASPLLFYGAAFWEHSLAILLSSLSLLLILPDVSAEKSNKWRLIYAGLPLGLSCVLREESYIFAASMAAALAWTGHWRRIIPLASGCAMILIPLWALQLSLYGSPLGSHASVYRGMEGKAGALQMLADIAENFHFYLIKFGNEGWPTTLLSILLLLAFLAGLSCRISSTRPWIAISIMSACLPLSAFLSLKFIQCQDFVAATRLAQALLPGTPFLIVLLLSSGCLLNSGEPSRRLLSSLCLAYAALACLSLNRADIGVIWGPRHFLPLFPLLTPLCVLAFDGLLEACPSKSAKVVLSALAAALLILGAGLQFYGLRLLQVKLEASSLLKTELERRAGQGPLISDVFWLPEEMGTLYHKIPMMQVGDSASLEEAVLLLRKGGVKRFTLVLSANPQFRKIGRDDMSRSLKLMKVEPGPQVAHPEADSMRCQTFLCEMD